MMPLRLSIAVFLLLLVVAGANVASAQSGAPAPTVEAIQKSIAAVKGDATLDELAKEALTKRYEEAVAHLEAAAEFERQAAALKSDLEKGPAETVAARKELEERRAGRIPDAAKESADAPADAGPEILDARLTSERTRISDLVRQVRDWETKLTELEARPAANRERIVAVTRLLSETEAELAKGSSQPPSEAQGQADLAHGRTRYRMLGAELAMLEQESPALDIRRDLYQARRDLADSDLELARARVVRLESRSGALVSARISEAERLIVELGLQAVTDEPKVKALVEATRLLGVENQSLLARIAAADRESTASTAELDRLRREAESIRAQIEIGGLEDSFAEIVLELHRTLPTPQSLRGVIEARRKEISSARLAAFRMNRELESMPSTDGQVEELLDLLRAKGVAEEALSKLRGGLGEFIDNAAKLRRDSIDGNRRLASLLGEVDLVANETLSEAARLRDYLGERLVWVASSPPLGAKAFTGLRTAFLELVGPESLAEYGKAVSRIDFAHWLLGALLTAGLLVPRPRLRRYLAASAARTRRISADSIANTLGALAASFWLALPVPVLLGFFGWIFASDSHGSAVTFALGKGLMAPALLLLVLRFSAILCWPDGVAEAHFRWRRKVLDPLKRGVNALIFLYLPAHILLAVWWHNGGDLAAFQGPGRLVFIAAMLALALILRAFFKNEDGILSQLEAPRGTLRRLRRVWIAIFLIAPLALAVLAALGHFLTAVALAYLMQKTGFVVFGGVLSYAFLTRWAALKGRRLALAEALAEREARRASQQAADLSALTDGDAPPQQDESPVTVEEEDPLDWAVVGEQAGHLIRAVVTLVVLFGCWLAWSEALPALKYLDTRPLFAGVSASDLIWLVIIGLITGIAFQNLPGLLELGFLRALELESGVRNAVVTLCQYIVIAVGAALAFDTLGLDWSRFGWIAAALSVGLGFGLQEVVANFVSGLILLFERPIRVGDIVTVGGIDGVVTKIRIRATTITTWDKKEFIVPNKEFVTGTILNWTLSSPVTRLVFPVGIAYGSDIPKARDILLEIARSQPEVLKDPEPAAVFERFGPSTLDFSLRCFVAKTEQRLEMTHRINTLIHERFTKEGIEMSFQHHEIHLRSVDPSIRLGIRGAEEEKEKR